ncbi:hydrogenase maturation nickel metallochaperone HypA [Legionella londiniensis]|uniref:Hydrogenase maturation factor HypA n=1 Tax=Legionella londiniensis TaxID=45068 RepID=A0A0W0VT11_9GAMM|nr:hydrogenase maturation nickel metallochaperone HypA [Legionella londiniensis]KTD23224.1 hydrogenase nickel incorporation protein HypA [Legionella londiniensis]STX93765.1 hydrogenase nickel incorporation protein HypA [Legionella londiniensis]
MHELSLCKNIINIINDHVKGDKALKVKKIALEAGLLTGVDHESLKFAFKIASQGTAAENAVLEIIPVEGFALCNHCQQKMPIAQYYDCCACGHFSWTVLQGEELKVKYMEVE